MGLRVWFANIFYIKGFCGCIVSKEDVGIYDFIVRDKSIRIWLCVIIVLIKDSRI